jgi:ABC-2 type transport system permease protein
MNKYLQVFKISFQQEFVYRLNFVMWRVRNILQILLVFFLWDTVFAQQGRVVFGYDRARILTYVFGLLIVRAFVLSARAMEVAGEVSRGDLSNYLIKPLSYFKYWLTRDISSKALNLAFAGVETFVLFLILKPPFFIQTNLLSLAGFLIAIISAMFIYFVLLFITSAVPFWMPEAGWAAHFLVTAVAVEFLSGALFPLDILPGAIQSVLSYTPFPYLIFFPLQVYLGKVTGIAMFKGIFVSFFWAVILWFVMSSVWKRGLKVYQAHGR